MVVVVEVVVINKLFQFLIVDIFIVIKRSSIRLVIIFTREKTKKKQRR